jgi:hypothetical protein
VATAGVDDDDALDNGSLLFRNDGSPLLPLGGGGEPLLPVVVVAAPPLLDGGQLAVLLPDDDGPRCC